MKINRQKTCLLSLSAMLFLCSGVAIAKDKEDGVCRVTAVASVVKTYTGQSDHLAFRFRWKVDAKNNVSTNLAGTVDETFNPVEKSSFDDKNRLRLFFGNYTHRGIFYYVEKNMDDNGNITMMKVHFSDVVDKSRIWEAVDLLCEITTNDETKYFPNNDSTMRYFRALSRPTIE
ncbi:MAG TPA: hypothetical protein VKR58_00610 [Aquella sp.]|nr:hypothetical protein [Aquella sp.]